MKQQLKDYLSFGKSERNAILFIMVLIVLVLILPAMFFSHNPPQLINSDEFATEIAQFMLVDNQNPATSQRDFNFNEPDKAALRTRFTPFKFDPNVLNEQGWKALGFSDRQAKGIIKYRNTGANFKTPEDLKKLYVFTDEVYKIFEPYITIQNQNTEYAIAKPNTKSTYPAYEQFAAELNSSDSATLVKVRGIGPVFAKRIIRYREKLGGYVSVAQLSEVYGMDSSRYELMRKGVFIDSSLIRKLNVNTASLEELRAHPYIDYYIAKAIVDARIRKGSFENPSELKNIPLVYEDLYYKLLPYIAID